MHGAAHFVVDSGHTVVLALVIPRQAHALSQVLQDPQIRPRLPRWHQRLFAKLHHAVGVADGAGFFRPGGGGQHHVSQPSSLGHEDVLHHQVLQRGQRVARMVEVGVTHGRVLTHDVHAADLVRVTVLGQGFAHDLDHGVAGLFVELGAPEIFKPGVRGGVVHALVVGEHHGNQTGVRRALYIVLATQWMQAGTRLADLAGDADQRDQATRVVGTVHMLADAHAPQNHGALGFGKGAGDFAQGLSGNAANRGHGFGAVAFDVVAQRLVVAGARGDEFLVHQAFVNHGVDQRIDHGHIGVGLELQGAPCVLPDFGDARVGQHDFCTALGGVFHPGGSHRVVGGWVRADDEDQVGVLHVIDLVAHRARTHAFEQCGHAGGVAQAGAMVDVVGAKAGAHQLLE